MLTSDTKSSPKYSSNAPPIYDDKEAVIICDVLPKLIGQKKYNYNIDARNLEEEIHLEGNGI